MISRSTNPEMIQTQNRNKILLPLVPACSHKNEQRRKNIFEGIKACLILQDDTHKCCLQSISQIDRSCTQLRFQRSTAVALSCVSKERSPPIRRALPIHIHMRCIPYRRDKFTFSFSAADSFNIIPKKPPSFFTHRNR